MNMQKASVIAVFNLAYTDSNDKKNIKTTPLKILTENGIKMKVNYVLDMRKAASLKSGINGDRYTCSVSIHEDEMDNWRDKVIFLYRDGDEWFIEEN